MGITNSCLEDKQRAVGTSLIILSQPEVEITKKMIRQLNQHQSNHNSELIVQKLIDQNFTVSLIDSLQNEDQRLKLQQQYVQQQIRKTNQFKKFQGSKIQQERISLILEQQQVRYLVCEICLAKIQKENLGVLKCNHSFHKQCIKQHIKVNVNQNKLKINCPSQNCQNMGINDLQQFGDTNTMKKYYEITFNDYVSRNHKDTSWCPTPNCTAVFVFDEDLTVYKCKICKKNYCLSCKSINHPGMTCKQFKINNVRNKDDEKFEQFVKGAKFKQCPKCNYWVQKTQGCNHMTCRCGKQFCYSCGQSYPCNQVFLQEQ